MLKGSGQKILLIEDDESVRIVAEETLINGNYKVFSASNAEEAIQVFQEQNGKFDLIFSDVVLPVLSGLQLVSELLTKNPKLKF